MRRSSTRSQSSTDMAVSAFNNLFGGSLGVLGEIGKSFAFKAAEHYLSKIKSAKENKEPVCLIIVRMTPAFQMLFDTNLLVTIEDYSIREDAKNGFASMVQDRRAGRKTEIDFINGAVVKGGRKYEIPTPVNETVVEFVHAFEESDRVRDKLFE